MRIKLLNSCYLLEHSNNISCIIESTNFIEAFAVHLGHSLIRVLQDQKNCLLEKLDKMLSSRCLSTVPSVNGKIC